MYFLFSLFLSLFLIEAFSYFLREVIEPILFWDWKVVHSYIPIIVSAVRPSLVAYAHVRRPNSSCVLFLVDTDAKETCKATELGRFRLYLSSLPYSSSVRPHRGSLIHSLSPGFQVTQVSRYILAFFAPPLFRHDAFDFGWFVPQQRVGASA